MAVIDFGFLMVFDPFGKPTVKDSAVSLVSSSEISRMSDAFIYICKRPPIMLVSIEELIAR